MIALSGLLLQVDQTLHVLISLSIEGGVEKEDRKKENMAGKFFWH